MGFDLENYRKGLGLYQHEREEPNFQVALSQLNRPWKGNNDPSEWHV